MSIPGLSLEGERGHRRGVVMGLTMAEIMLLLLFCLLLASAGIIHEREQALDEAKSELEATRQLVGGQFDGVDLAVMHKRLEELEAESSRIRELIPQQDAPSSPVPEETWRKLQLSAEAGAPIVEAGISASEVISAVQEIRSRTVALSADTGPGVHDWPPIITLSNDTFRFPINSAELSNDFAVRLNGEVAKVLRGILERYDVDVIEVVGHTDESPIATTRTSTMDQNAVGALSGDVNIADLVPADNVGLGLARAISVAHSLDLALADMDVKIIPLSAAQLVMPGDIVSTRGHGGNDSSRRRIEIRVRKSNGEVAP